MSADFKRIQFKKTFESDTFGARRAHVENAIRSADGYVDTRTEDDRKSGTQYLTLHSRAMPSRDATDFVWIIISVVDRDGTLTPMNAFRAYTNDVSIPDPSDAVAALRAFANEFGFEAEWGPAGRTRFLEDVRLPREAADLAGKIPANTRCDAILLIKPISSSGEVHARWSFLLDPDKYERALSQRGKAN